MSICTQMAHPKLTHNQNFEKTIFCLKFLMCLWGANTHSKPFWDFFQKSMDINMLLGTKKLGGTAHFLVYHVDETSKKWHFSPKIGTLQKFLRPKMGVLGAGWPKNFRPEPKTPKSVSKKILGVVTSF